MTEPTQTTQVTWPDPADRVQPGRTEPLARGWVEFLGCLLYTSDAADE